MTGRRQRGRGGGKRSRQPSPLRDSTPQRAAPAGRGSASIDRGAAVAAVVSTAVLFGLMLLGLWVGDTVYEALPLGPLPRSRFVSALATLLTMGAGVGLIYLLMFVVRRGKR